MILKQITLQIYLNIVSSIFTCYYQPTLNILKKFVLNKIFSKKTYNINVPKAAFFHFRCPNMGQPWMLLRAAAILLVTRQTLALSDM